MESILIIILINGASSFVAFFLLDKLIVKFFKLSELISAIISFVAVEILFILLNSKDLALIFTAVWFIVALIAIYIDKKKEREQKTELPGGNNNN